MRSLSRLFARTFTIDNELRKVAERASFHHGIAPPVMAAEFLNCAARIVRALPPHLQVTEEDWLLAAQFCYRAANGETPGDLAKLLSRPPISPHAIPQPQIASGVPSSSDQSAQRRP